MTLFPFFPISFSFHIFPVSFQMLGTAPPILWSTAGHRKCLYASGSGKWVLFSFFSLPFFPPFPLFLLDIQLSANSCNYPAYFHYPLISTSKIYFTLDTVLPQSLCKPPGTIVVITKCLMINLNKRLQESLTTFIIWLLGCV